MYIVVRNMYIRDEIKIKKVKNNREDLRKEIESLLDNMLLCEGDSITIFPDDEVE